MAATKAQQHLREEPEDARDTEPNPEASGLSTRGAL
jgi:hypothetical protein